MNIIYLTTSVRPSEFALLELVAYDKPNPAGQNFHEKIIRSLAPFGPIEVVSLTSASLFGKTQIEEARKDRIPYFYVDRPESKLARRCCLPGRIAKMAKALAKDKNVIVYDSLNVALARASVLLAKKLHCPRIAIVTDNPDNISAVTRKYADSVLALSEGADGYFVLSEPLNRLFNRNEKPYLVAEGIVEPMAKGKPLHGEGYLYFAGALYERYGVNDLLEAYDKARPDYFLYLAGHGPLDQYLSEYAQTHKKVRFLGQLSKSDHYAMLEHAAFVINPRPFERALDEESIPSKVLEDIASGSNVISTMHTKLHEIFPDSVSWIERSGEEGIEEFFRFHEDGKGRFVGLAVNVDAARIQTLYGIKVIGEKFYDLLTKVSSASI